MSCLLSCVACVHGQGRARRGVQRTEQDIVGIPAHAFCGCKVHTKPVRGRGRQQRRSTACKASGWLRTGRVWGRGEATALQKRTPRTTTARPQAVTRARKRVHARLRTVGPLVQHAHEPLLGAALGPVGVKHLALDAVPVVVVLRPRMAVGVGCRGFGGIPGRRPFMLPPSPRTTLPLRRSLEVCP